MKEARQIFGKLLVVSFLHNLRFTTTKTSKYPKVSLESVSWIIISLRRSWVMRESSSMVLSRDSLFFAMLCLIIEQILRVNESDNISIPCAIYENGCFHFVYFLYIAFIILFMSIRFFDFLQGNSETYHDRLRLRSSSSNF